jgi:hypothetical protein
VTGTQAWFGFDDGEWHECGPLLDSKLRSGRVALAFGDAPIKRTGTIDRARIRTGTLDISFGLDYPCKVWRGCTFSLTAGIDINDRNKPVPPTRKRGLRARLGL